jgi:mRNA interferase YafQ
MSLKVFYLNSFKKEIKKLKKRGKNLSKITIISSILIEGKKLPKKYKEHKLKGNYVGYWECHIEPDWLLIYKKTKKTIIFARTGSHSDLF